jgi:hypothetical protein
MIAVKVMLKQDTSFIEKITVEVKIHVEKY